MRRAILTAWAALTLWGCDGAPILGGGSLKPDDFERGKGKESEARAAAEQLVAASETNPAPADAAPAPQSETTLPPPTAPPVAAAPGPAPDEHAAIVVDGMVGQIRGKPVFASEVFQEIGDEVLTRLGAENNRAEFRRRCADLIDATLRQWLYSRLELTEAERSLSERERQALPGLRKIERERIIARYGQGVPSVADQVLIDRYGFNLEHMVEQYIQGQVIRYYRDKKVKPKVHVNRREVERYFRDHPDEFSPPPTVTVRVIIVREPAIADQVDQALGAGQPFEAVAALHSAFRKAEGGLLPPFTLKGPLSSFNELNWPALNERVRGLKLGEKSGRVPIGENFGWVMLQDLQAAESRTLQQAFLEIEDRLKEEKEKKVQRQLMLELYANGNFTRPEEMSEALIRVAMAKYAKPQ